MKTIIVLFLASGLQAHTQDQRVEQRMIETQVVRMRPTPRVSPTQTATPDRRATKTPTPVVSPTPTPTRGR